MKKALVLQKYTLCLELEDILVNEAGFIAHNAKDAYEAIKMTERDFFDLIILDTENLGMESIELAKTIKSKPSYNNVPIIALTNNESPQEKQKFLYSYFEDYLSFSVGVNELIRSFKKYKKNP